MNKELSITRRTLVGGSFLVGAGMALAGSTQVFITPALAEGAVGDQSTETIQHGFWIDTRRCVGCENCVVACRKHNKTPEDMPSRRKVVHYVSDAGEKIHISTACMHCVSPSCVAVCPAAAIEKRADGIVEVRKKRCMGCKYCYQACPFEVPHYAPEGMDKCDCCLENGAWPKGDPQCVQACNKGALRFDTMERLKALAGSAAEPLVASTNPSCLIS